MRFLNYVAGGALLALVASPLAAEDAATCAAKLDAAGKAIFDAALADVSAGGDLKEVVTEHTKALVAAGTLARGDARSAATAAAACLKLAQG